ncbi:MAG: glycosyltransferase [Patescibacteria group bacterium]|nr:glycosyltransferase [Patescibacteria group bacterium]
MLSQNQQNHNPLVSVIMASHNGQEHIKEAINSILSQTLADFEFLIVNDCSTDRTTEILQAFQKKDERIKIINNGKNLGLTRSLNKALCLASGKFIARMDDDDIARPERLEKQFDFMLKNPETVLCGSLAFVIDSGGKIIGEKNLALDYQNIKKGLLFNNQFIHSSLFMLKSVLDKEGFYDEKFKKAQDYELVLRLAAKYPVANLAEKLLQWRMSPNSISFSGNSQQKYALKARWYAIAKYGYPKIRGMFHILARAAWLLVPQKIKQKIK